MLIRLTATRAILNAQSPIFRSCEPLPGEPAIVNTLSPFPNSQDSLGYLLSSVSRGRIEIARRVDRACLKRIHYFSSPSKVALSSESLFLFLIWAISWIQADRRNCSSGVMLIFSLSYSLYFTYWQPICTHRDAPSRIIVSKPRIWCWRWLEQLGIRPGNSLYFQGIKVIKTKASAGFDVGKGKRNYQGWTVNKAWFFLTNLGFLPR